MILFGLVIDVALVYIAIRKKDISKGSKDYYIESFSDHLDLHSEVKEPKTIAFSDILRMERFSRELKKFKDNNISADFEQAEYPCIHIATGNDHLYKLTYAQGKKKKEVIVDIYDVEQFELIVFQGDSKFKGPREIVKKNFIKLTCPRCDHDFDVDADTRVLECPKCGVKGDL